MTKKSSAAKATKATKSAGVKKGYLKMAEPTTLQQEKYESYFLDEVDTSFENIRTGDFTAEDSDAGSDGNGQSFEQLTESMAAEGQKTPAPARPFHDPKRKNIKVQIVGGFRRYAALMHIQKASGERQKIKCVVKQLDDLGALIENTIENARHPVRPADAMMRFARIKSEKLQRGTDLSNRALAGLLGFNHSYVSDLLAIRAGAPEVSELWHKAQYQLGIRDLRAIAKLVNKDGSPNLPAQKARYEELLKNRMPQDPGDGEGEGEGGANPLKWIETACKKAESAAALLGHLERRDCIKLKNFEWHDELETLGCKIKADAKASQLKKIGKRAQKAYTDALNYVEPEEETDETEEAAE